MKTLIKNGYIVNEERVFKGDIIVENGIISEVSENPVSCGGGCDEVIDAAEGMVLPGVIDSHVHFREPGFTHKADMETESRAAACGGVTSFFDMPNTVPQTTSLSALNEKMRTASERSHINYAFFFGVTNDNIDETRSFDYSVIPGLKVFMGASTGNMLVDDETVLDRVFSNTRVPVVTHCEDSKAIKANMKEACRLYGDDPDVCHHSEIRDVESCCKSTALAVRLAEKYGTRLHVAHISTAKELALLRKSRGITAEAVIGHLLFSEDDYKRLGTKIKCNPSVKTINDREALREALTTGEIATVATDHAPHLLSEKEGGCVRAASGMPMVQFSLVSMLELVDSGVLSIERLVRLMCHNPARLFGVQSRGFIRRGYKADITVVNKGEPWRVTKDIIQSKCGWSPVQGHCYHWLVSRTICNGRTVYGNNSFNDESRGEQILFRH